MITLFAIMMLSATSVLATETSNSNSLQFEFSKNDAGFIPIFADYPNQEDVEKFYEFESGLKKIPIENAGMGLFISGNNHSDDLFMGYYKEISGLLPNQAYCANVLFKIATNVEHGMIGIGDSPASSVYVKCGISTIKPEAMEADLDFYRLNIDKGNQGSEGKDAKIVGTIGKQESLKLDEYEFNEYTAMLEFTTNQDGNAYLLIGTDSGFEGPTSYYINNVELQLTEKSAYEYSKEYEKEIKKALDAGIIENTQIVWKEDITRLQFCEFAYDMLNAVKEFPAVNVFKNPFSDTNSYKVSVLYVLGIVQGKGEEKFVPDDKINREEAAVILYRIAQYMKIEFSEVDLNVYLDNASISKWVSMPVYSLNTLNVMSDATSDLFNPKKNYKIEEAIYSLIKLFEIIKTVN